MLPRRHRLNRPEDFRAVVRSGARVGGSTVVVHVRRTSADATAGPDLDPVPPTRAGLVIGRSVGPAVTRNRVARRLRAHLGRRLVDLPPGLDIVVRALPAAGQADFARLSADADRCLEKAVSRVGRRPGTVAGGVS